MKLIFNFHEAGIEEMNKLHWKQLFYTNGVGYFYSVIR